LQTIGNTNATAASSDVQAKLRVCPLCGGSDRRLLAQRDGWDIVECTACEMVFLGSELAYDVQAEEYDWLDEYDRERSRRKQKHPLLMALSRSTAWLKPNTNDRLLSQTLHWRWEGNLVDFGCGDGTFLAMAGKHFDVTGIELSPRFADLARRVVAADRIIEGAVTQVAENVLSAASFDVVTQLGYIEHEWHPISGLRAAWRVLKPGGVVVIKTPNYASWNRRVMGADWCGYHVPAHCNYFTPQTLRRILRQTGFRPLAQPLVDRLPTSDSLWMAAEKAA
jgi:2-polyprenyl-3-methyl-5-hydroxy-6-metoxy-1,4-benzoquinol methylase